MEPERAGEFSVSWMMLALPTEPPAVMVKRTVILPPPKVGFFLRAELYAFWMPAR